MIKLIVADIDGTLLEDGGNALNPELFGVILKLRKQGIQFAAASGRQWASIEQVFDPIKEKIFYLSDNGAYIGCHKSCLLYTSGGFRMKTILFIASEAVPFIKTGGLADVVGSLPKCFDKEYFDVRVMIPKYLCIKEEWRNKMNYVSHFYMDYMGTSRYVGILEYVCLLYTSRCV